jgi:DNA-directed RNA polymerase I subunit RPA43
MLSLLGSIQADPFSPEHVPETASSLHAPSEELDQQSLGDEPDIEMDDDHETDDYDTFRDLGKLGDEAAAKEKARIELVEKDKKDKKRKRKSGEDERQTKREKKEKQKGS